MNSEKNLTCIICPIGCKIAVKYNGKEFEFIKGYKCIKGIEYTKNEIMNPRRILTTSVLVKNGQWPLVSVKSSEPIKKEKIFNILNKIKKTTVNAPVKSGKIILKNVDKTGIDIVSTKTIKKSKK
jgi:CxxC motif-containing protein